MYIIWANNFIGNVGVWAAGVDRAPFIKEPCTILALHRPVGILESHLRLHMLIAIQDNNILGAHF